MIRTTHVAPIDESIPAPPFQAPSSPSIGARTSKIRLPPHPPTVFYRTSSPPSLVTNKE